MKADLDNAKGLDRAKILDKLIDTIAKVGKVKGIPPKEVTQWSREIVSLDPDNKAGLKQKHEFPVLMADAQEQFQQRNTKEGEALIAKALALPKLKPEQIQQANFALGLHYLQAKDYQKGIDVLKKASDAAPNTPLARILIKNILQQAEKAQKADKDKNDEM